jgi:hypothetical protein
MSEHTPGPWRYEIDGPSTNDMRHAVLSEYTGLWVAATYRSGTRAEDDSSLEADDEAKANARLIAAAPDLLFQLLAASNYIDALGGDSKSYRAAIAKAKGGAV